MSRYLNMLSRLRDAGRLPIVTEHEPPSERPTGDLPARHEVSSHTPCWAFMPPQNSKRVEFPRLYNADYAELDLEGLLAETRFFVFVGAAESPELKCIRSVPGAVAWVFEPSLEEFQRYLEATSEEELLRGSCLYFPGDAPGRHEAQIMDLPREIAERGYPAVLIQPGLGERHPAYVELLTRLAEFFYYRHRIYPFTSFGLREILPFRKMSGGLFYDQIRHAYQNIGRMVSKGNVRYLKNALKGRPAILAGAGPDLQEKIAFLKRSRDRAAIFCVNNALKALLANDVIPHFVVINDSSMNVEESIDGLPPLPDTVLISHCLAYTGKNIFDRIFFNHNWRQDVFPARPANPIHGSVITNAMTLAEYMGCNRFYLVGVQLASTDPFTFTYTKESIHGSGIRQKGDRSQTNRYPQFYPAPSAGRRPLYTTLNFYDTALWMRHYILKHQLKMINTSEDSILFGRGFELDADPHIDAPDTVSELTARLKMRNYGVDPDKVQALIQSEIKVWEDMRKMAKNAERLAGYDEHLPLVASAIQNLDDNGVSFMLGRFPGFNNRHFDHLFFRNGIAERREGGAYYFARLATMSEELLRILAEQAETVEAIASTPPGDSPGRGE